MKLRQNIFLLLTAFVLSSATHPVAASDNDVDVLLNMVKSFYTVTKEPGAAEQNVQPCYLCIAQKDGVLIPELVRKFFSPSLAQFHLSHDNNHCADFALLVDGQDEDISGFRINAPNVAGDVAQVLVRFKNFGEPNEIHFDFARVSGNWRIEDYGPSGLSLRDTLRQCAKYKS
ncbi:MAG: hypothetical protein HWE34_11990 [Methylocystaceae bacterium]|nr:hypothetical protein [Methylocystaceae bacterium]